MTIDGRALELLRLAEGESREGLATKLGVSPRTIANWEKNGIPAHREGLVLSRFGARFREAMIEADHLRSPAAPELPAAEEWSKPLDRLAGQPSRGRSDLSLREVLRPYSTETLLNEVRLRVDELELQARSVPSADPDYSKMEDPSAYGLAAKKGDKHIDHDQLPEEP